MDRKKAPGVDENVTVSPLFIDVVKQLGEKYSEEPNDAYHRQMLYAKLQQAMREYVNIDGSHGG